MSAEKVGLRPFKTVIFGDYAAQKYGDTVVVKGKDGSVQTMEVKEFMKFMAEHVPQVKSQPDKDTFVKKLTTMEKPSCDDSAIAKINKSIHNAGTIFFNPSKSFDYITGKYN